MATEEFGRKDYFHTLDLEGVRLRMKISSKVVPTIRSHFKRKYREQSLRCQSCKHPPSRKEASQPESNSNEVDKIQTSESTSQAKECSPNDNEDFPLDSSSHLIHHCPTFRKNLLNKDLSKGEDIVSFFKEIIKHRTENNEDWIFPSYLSCVKEAEICSGDTGVSPTHSRCLEVTQITV